jgi:hypothetical protein
MTSNLLKLCAYLSEQRFSIRLATARIEKPNRGIVLNTLVRSAWRTRRFLSLLYKDEHVYACLNMSVLVVQRWASHVFTTRTPDIISYVTSCCLQFYTNMYSATWWRVTSHSENTRDRALCCFQLLHKYMIYNMMTCFCSFAEHVRSSRFQTFAVVWILCMYFWVFDAGEIPKRT